MAIINIPAYQTTDHEGTGLQYATDKYNARQLAKNPPGATKTVLQFWLMAARTLVNDWYNQSITEQARAAAKAVQDANPPDFVPPPE